MEKFWFLAERFNTRPLSMTADRTTLRERRLACVVLVLLVPSVGADVCPCSERRSTSSAVSIGVVFASAMVLDVM